jgi:hypothetical protein
MDNSRDVAGRASMRHVDEVAGISYGHSIRYSDEKAKLARKEADKLACEAWTMRMLAYKGPAPSTPGDHRMRATAIEVRCLGCDAHQTVALNIVRRPPAKQCPLGLLRCTRHLTTSIILSRHKKSGYSPKIPCGELKIGFQSIRALRFETKRGSDERTAPTI